MIQKRRWHTSTLVSQVIGVFAGDILYDFHLPRPLLLAPAMDNKKENKKKNPLVLGSCRFAVLLSKIGFRHMFSALFFFRLVVAS